MNPNKIPDLRPITYTPGTDADKTRKAILTGAQSLEGRARLRTLGAKEVADFLAILDRNDPAAETVRVYSYEGFVANSYDYPALITTAEAKRQPNGDYVISIWRANAKRSHGQGPLLTINNKGIA